jgi:hypothetical protein
MALAVAATAALITPAQAGLPSAPARATGDVMIILDDSFQAPMFKGGVFIYGASEVSVALGDSGQLSAIFPLNGMATATSKVITVDPESGGLEFFNGPAGASAGLGSLVIRRSGSTGTILGRINGPYSTDAGQYSQTMPVFAMTAIRTRKQGSGWLMQANLTITGDAATAMNTLLKTSVFTPGTKMGVLMATVGGSAS